MSALASSLVAPMAASPLAAAASATTIDGVFRRAFEIFADRVAVTSEEGAATYREVRDRAWRLASALSGTRTRARRPHRRTERDAAAICRDLRGRRGARRHRRRAQHPPASGGAALLSREGRAVAGDRVRRRWRRRSKRCARARRIVADWVALGAARGLARLRTLLARSTAGGAAARRRARRHS